MKDNILGISAVHSENPGNTNGHPVGEVVTIFLARSHQIEVLEDGLESAENTAGDGENARGQGDRELRQGHSLSNSLPGNDRRGREGARINSLIADAGISGHEEDEDTGSEEHGDQGAGGLRVELQLGRGSQKETDAEIADQVGGDVRSAGSNVTGNEVDSLGIVDCVVTLGDATIDQL